MSEDYSQLKIFVYLIINSKYSNCQILVIIKNIQNNNFVVYIDKIKTAPLDSVT